MHSTIPNSPPQPAEAPVAGSDPTTLSGPRHFSRDWAIAGVFCVLAAGGAWLLVTALKEKDSPRPGKKVVQSYRVKAVRSFPHDKNAFTQGLVFHDGKLYESTGLEGESSLRLVELETGKVQKQHDLPRQMFGEGLALAGGELFQLTWQNEVAYVYDQATLKLKRQFRYRGEGWGLAFDGTHLILSDGTATLQFLDPKTFRVVRRVKVRDRGFPVEQLNELEYIEGEVYANVWRTDEIVRIDPATGKLTGRIDLSDLWPQKDRDNENAVLNGIAYDPARKRLFVTGKNWPRIYEVKLVEK
jgi:glutamine cyclotransferase